MSVSVTICLPNCIGGGVGTLKGSMPSAEELRTRIEDALPGADVNVIDTTGGGDHFRAEIVSERFEGLTRIQQHKLIYDVFGDEVGGAIHALSIKTGTPSPAGDGR
jgi:stress-induced morphogen